MGALKNTLEKSDDKNELKYPTTPGHYINVQGHIVLLKLRCTRTDRAKHVYGVAPYIPIKYLINERIS